MISSTNEFGDINYLRLLFADNSDGYINDYKKLTDLLPALVVLFDADRKKLTYVNKQFYNLLGYSPDDLTAFDYDWNKIIFEDDLSSFEQELKTCLTLPDDSSHSYQNRLNHKKGNWLYFRTKASVMRRDEDGKPTSLLFIAEDITQQQMSTDELHRTKELISETEKMHSFGMYSYDLDTQRFVWSDGVYKLFDVTREEEPSPSFEFFEKFVVPEDRDKLNHIRHEFPSGTSELENSFSIQTAAGDIKIFLNIMKAVRDDDRKIIKYIGSLRDITKETLYDRELQKTIKDLTSSNKELEDFAYVASHDMQEPLRKITTFSTRLSDKFKSELGSEGQMYLERMNVAANNMRMLIENLLEISRTARDDYHFTKTSINDIILKVKSELELSIEEHNVTITIDDNIPEVEAVPSLMMQLFSNLLNNAIKFRSANPPVIAISSRIITKPEREKLLLPEKKFVEIMVTDNGIGFEQEFAERVFQIFQRLHGKAEYPGSGIGLSICKKIVDKHNGIIYASSEPGKGSTFHIILPEKH